MPDSPAMENLKLLLKTFEVLAENIEKEADPDVKKEVQKDLDNLRFMIQQNQSYLDSALDRTDRAVSNAMSRLKSEEERLRALAEKRAQQPMYKGIWDPRMIYRPGDTVSSNGFRYEARTLIRGETNI